LKAITIATIILAISAANPIAGAVITTIYVDYQMYENFYTAISAIELCK